MRMVAVVRSEWTKVRTLRATVWTLLPTVVLGIGLGALVSLALRDARTEPYGEVDPIFATFYGLTLAQLPLVVFGVMLVASEYRSGTIRPSLLATPHRGRFYAGKVLTGAGLASVVSLGTVLGTFAAAQATLGPRAVSLTDPGVTRAVVGAWLYLTLICLFAVGVAAMVRGAVVALSVLLPLLFLNSQGLGNIPGARTVLQFLPDQAGQFIMHMAGPPDDPVFDRVYGPWTGLAILALWTAAALAGGHLVLRHRDA